MMIRTLIASLVLALTAAVAEVLIRWHLSPDTVQAPQLALAVFSNVAVLGLGSVALTAAGWPVVGMLARLRGNVRSRRNALVSSVLLGVVAAVLFVATGALGLAPLIDSAVVVVACGLVLGAGIGAYGLRARRLCVPPLPASLRGGSVIAWGLCVAATAIGVSRTNGQIEHWMGRNDRPLASTSAPAPHIVLVVLDTLRADCVGAAPGRPRSLTPNLDRLAESSVVYTNALSTAPWTLPSHASLFTGLYPDRHGVNWGHYALDDRWPVLSELLKSKGYNTFAISNNWLLSRDNGFARGFDTYIETATDPALGGWRLALRCGLSRLLATGVGLAPEVAEDAGSAWTNWLVRRRLAQRASSEGPLFLFINYFEPHDPYRPPLPFARGILTSGDLKAARHLDQREQYLAAHACGQCGVFSREQVALMKRLYDAEVAYQDHMVGALLDTLKAANLFDQSWLVVMSDHGELFGEWDMVYHTASSHYQLLHIPLLVRPPGGTDGRRLKAPVQPVDIFVTLLEEAGVEVPASVCRAHRLPWRADEPSERFLSVAQSHGASIAGLSMTQRIDMQSDLARWLTWVDSVYADGYLLEIGSSGHQALFEVARDPDMELDQVHALPRRARSLAEAFGTWRADIEDVRRDHERKTHARVSTGGSDRRVVSAGPRG
jgi:arylsulfatase A-like enzyme